MNVLDAMRERVLVAEGAMGTRLFFKGIPQDDCLEALNLTNPSVVREVHVEYRDAGAEVFKTNTFGANTLRLARHNAEARCREINIAGVQIAREIAGQEGFVAGTVGPLGESGVAGTRRIFEIQIEALAKAEADFILLETFTDLDQLHDAILAARASCGLPVVAQVSPDEDGEIGNGIGPAVFVPRLTEWGADAVGYNCGYGPMPALEAIAKMAAVADKPLTVQPSAGLPFYQNGQLVYPSLPEELADATRRFVALGVRMIGGCCGTIPDHIAALREAVDLSAPASGKHSQSAKVKPTR